MILNKRIHNMAVFIEFLAGSGLAILFHWLLHMPEAASIIFGVGVLLSLATYLLREDVEKTREVLLDRYHQAHEITFAVASISDPECQAKAQDLLAGTKRTLALLQQGFIPLDEAEFYPEGAKYCDLANRQVRAVDPLTPGWHSRGALVNFYQANLRALERGVPMTRIFVASHEELTDPEVQKVLLSQFQDGIEVRIAFRDELPTASDISGRDTNSSCNFAIYDDQAVTEVFAQPGKYFGRKTSQPQEVAKYQRLFHLIEHNSHVIEVAEGRLIVAGEVIPPYALAS